MEAQSNAIENNKLLAEQRIKWFMEMLAVKKDAGMTRIYSAFSKPAVDPSENLQEADNYDNLDF